MQNIDLEDSIKENLVHIEEAESLTNIILNSLLDKQNSDNIMDIINSISILSDKISVIKTKMEEYIENLY